MVRISNKVKVSIGLGAMLLGHASLFDDDADIRAAGADVVQTEWHLALDSTTNTGGTLAYSSPMIWVGHSTGGSAIP